MGRFTGQLKDLGGEVLHDSGQIDGGTSTNTGGIVSLAEETVNTSNGELETSTAGPGLGLSLNFSTFTTSGHFDCLMFGYKLMPAVSGAAVYMPSPDSRPQLRVQVEKARELGPRRRHHRLSHKRG